MNKMTLIAASLALMTAGCSTVIHGTRQKIGLSSNPSGAQVLVDGKSACVTPCIYKMSRRRGHTIEFLRDGYEERGYTITRDASGWMFGNLIIGGPVGLAIDLLSGGGFILEPKTIDVSLNRDGKGND